MKLRHLLAASALISAAHATAATITITTATGTGADAGIRSDVGGGNNNYGAATQMILGSNVAPLGGLLRFDLSGLIAAAGGGTITINSVTLGLHTTTAGSGGAFTLGLFSYGFNFTEGAGNGTVVAGATWNNPTGSGTDTTPGGTAGSQIQTLNLTSTAGGQSLSFATSSAFASALQSALTPGTVSFLLQETTTSTTDQTFARFDTKETSGGVAPTLNIDYTVTPVPEPSAYGFAGAGALAAVALIRRRRRSV